MSDAPGRLAVLNEAEAPVDARELAEMLALAPSGLAFIYQALDALGEAYDLRELVVVVDSDHVGRQAFRRGRRRIGDVRHRGPVLDAALGARPGLHADPPAVDAALGRAFVHLAEVALRVDMLGHDASHDSLTGLLNRRSYTLALDQTIARTDRYGWPFAMVLLDIDHFKEVNDRLGHPAGDAALRAMGGGLRASLRRGDVAARLGGDEFALLVVNAGPTTVLEPITRRLRGALDRGVPGTDIRFSTGVAFFPADAGDADNLIRVADERLYACKAQRGEVR